MLEATSMQHLPGSGNLLLCVRVGRHVKRLHWRHVCVVL